MTSPKPAHFLELTDFKPEDLKQMLKLAHAIKATNGKPEHYLSGETLCAIFDKPSTRTIASFFSGMAQLGGQTQVLTQDTLKIDKVDPEKPGKECIEHTAGALSQYFSIMSIRITKPELLTAFAANATVPVINAMTDDSHPCQIMADLMTIEEKLGSFEGKKIAWFGDWNNMSKTYAQAARLFPSIELVMAVPAQHQPQVPQNFPNNIKFVTNPAEAAKHADVIVTDVWTSMGQSAKDEAAFEPYQVNEALMAHAKPTAIFMHCMPVTPARKEVTQAVLDSPASVILQEAGNRMYVQQAIMIDCLVRSEKLKHPSFQHVRKAP